MTRELAFPGPKSRSTLFEHPEHVPSFIYLTNMVRRFVEANYNLELGPAQVTQLNKAISNGADKGTFYLPKGTSATVYIGYLLILPVQVSLDALSFPQRLLRITILTPKR